MKPILYLPLITILLCLPSVADAQFKEDSTESNQEGYIMYNSHLSSGIGSFQAEGFTSQPGFSYEAGVSARYIKGSHSYDVSLLASSRCASIPEAQIQGLRLTYLVLTPAYSTTRAGITTSIGFGAGIPIRAGSQTHGVKNRIPLNDVGPLFEARGKLGLDLSTWLPFDIFAAATYPLNSTGSIQANGHSFVGRSSTIQIGIANH